MVKLRLGSPESGFEGDGILEGLRGPCLPRKEVAVK